MDAGHSRQSDQVAGGRHVHFDIQESFLMAVYCSHCHGFALFNVTKAPPVAAEGSLDGSGLAGDTAPRTPGLDIFKYQYVSQIKNNL